MAEENKSFEVAFEDNKLKLSLDPNKDGQKVLTANIHLGEAIQEAFKRGDSMKVDGVKIVAFEFQLTKLILKLDTDQDGEEVLDLEIDLTEALDEIGLLKS